VKRCKDCGERKGDEHMVPGRSWCRDCRRAYKREWQRRWRDKRENRTHERSEARKHYAERGGRKGTYRPSIKRRARNAVRVAVMFGQITPADACERCGHDFSFFRRESHHPSYERAAWLEVEWLCSKCHGEEHAEDSV